MVTFYQDDQITLHAGDALEVTRTLPAGTVDCIVTSPPYYCRRDYGVDGQYGLEADPLAYVHKLRQLFTECRRVLADDGTLWLNIGDSYVARNGGYAPDAPSNKARRAARGSFAREHTRQLFARDRPRIQTPLPDKNLLGIPWRVAFALQADGWILRNAIIWDKPAAMPENVADRLSNRHEHIFLLTKSAHYWFNLDPIRQPHQTIQPFKRTDRNEWVGTTANVENHNRTGTQGGHENGRNPGDLWTLANQPFAGAHMAAFPIQIPMRAIQAGCKPAGTVLDPFNGAGTTGQAATMLGRRYIGIDINPQYLELTLRTRLHQMTFAEM